MANEFKRRWKSRKLGQVELATNLNFCEAQAGRFVMTMTPFEFNPEQNSLPLGVL